MQGENEPFIEIDSGPVVLIGVMWFLSIALSWYIAEESARSPSKWVLWSFLCGPLGTLALLASISYENFGRR